MEEAPENGKESSHSARANGMNEWIYLIDMRLENFSELGVTHLDNTEG
jgi:hypothetical protein